jgi:hypothetical protein
MSRHPGWLLGIGVSPTPMDTLTVPIFTLIAKLSASTWGPEALSCGLADIRTEERSECHFNRSEGQRQHPGHRSAPFSENEV